MGIFSMYTGLVYNDIFSLAMTFFKSSYEFVEEGPNRWVGVKSGAFSFGVDPVIDF